MADIVLLSLASDDDAPDMLDISDAESSLPRGADLQTTVCQLVAKPQSRAVLVLCVKFLRHKGGGFTIWNFWGPGGGYWGGGGLAGVLLHQQTPQLVPPAVPQSAHQHVLEVYIYLERDGEMVKEVRNFVANAMAHADAAIWPNERYSTLTMIHAQMTVGVCR